MATQVRIRRGNTAQHSTFTGALAEITVDTDKNTLVVHDGVTAGGIPLAKASDVIDANNAVASYVNLAVSTANVAMKGYVDNEIYILTANAATQANLIADLYSNAAVQSGDLGTLYGNAAFQAGEIGNLYANAAFQAGEIDTLYSNAAVQAGSIAELFANAALQSGNLAYIQADITTLFGNAAVQAGDISSLYTIKANLSGSTFTGNIVLGTATLSDVTGTTALYATDTNGNITLVPNGSGVIDVTDSKIRNVSDPLESQDAVTLSYLNTALSSSVSGLILDDTTFAITDDGVNAGYISATVDGTLVSRINSGNIEVFEDIIISGNIVPTVDAVYDLGSANLRFRDGYFSGNSLYIGEESISTQDGVWTFSSGNVDIQLGANVPLELSAANISGNLISGNIYSDHYFYGNGQSIFTNIDNALSALTANAGVQAGELGNLLSNAAYQAGEITNLYNNAAAQAGDLGTLYSNAAVQAGSIAELFANAALQSGNLAYIQADIITLFGNAAVQAGEIANLWVNAGSQSGSIASLESNAAVQAGEIANLWANAASQAGDITDLYSNAAVQAGEIANLWANAASQAGSIAAVEGNIATANTAMKGYIDSEISSINANAVSQSGEIANLWANAGAQAGSISSLESNAAVQAGEIANLWANAASQAGAITDLYSNAAVQAGLITAAEGNIVTANTAMKGYVDNEVSTLNSNAAVQAGEIANLWANAASQAGDITTLFSNAAVQAGEIANLWANAASQAGDITTLFSNAATQAGEIGNLYLTKADLSGATFTGPIVINNDLTLSGNLNLTGNVTQFDTNNITISDSILELHYHGGNLFAGDDGRDIGLRLHYYKGVNDNAFLGWANDTGYLEWYGANVTESNAATITGEYGTFKTGNILLLGNITALSYRYANGQSIFTNIDSALSALDSNAAVQAGEIANLWANAASQAGDITTLFSNAAAQAGLIAAAEGNIITANTAMKGYVDSVANNSSYSNANVTSYLPTHSGNIAGTLSTSGQPYVTSLGNLVSLNVNGNVTAQQFISTGAGTATLSATTNLDLSANAAVRIVGGGVLRLPQLTTTERDNLVGAAGDIIYNTTLSRFQTYQSSNWSNVATGIDITSGTQNRLAYYANNGNVLSDTGSGLTWDGATLSTTGTISAAGQVSYVRAYFDNLAALTAVNATTWHGMVAHVHETGRMYFAHAGAWAPIANYSDVTAANTAMQGYVDNQVSTLTANAAAQAGELATLTANAAAQAGELATLTANAASQAGELATLTANAGVQAGALATLTANAAAQAGAISELYTIKANLASPTFTGNIATGGILTNNYFYANGTPVSFGGGGISGNLFSTIAVAGQSSVIADSNSDTLTLAAGAGISITTDATTDTILITATGSGTGGGGSNISNGTSNVTIPISGGNIQAFVNGNLVANITESTTFFTSNVVVGNISTSGNANIGNIYGVNYIEAIHGLFYSNLIVGNITTIGSANVGNITGVNALSARLLYGNLAGGGTTSNIFVSTHLHPTANVTYDLGTNTQRWRDLYLSGNTIYLGEALISTTGNTVQLPPGSGVSGNVIRVGNANITANTANTSTIDLPANTRIGNYAIRVVSALPGSPDPNTIYFVTG